MAWTERQRQMLAAMGVRLWLPGEGAAPGEEAAVPVVQPPPPGQLRQRAAGSGGAPLSSAGAAATAGLVPAKPSNGETAAGGAVPPRPARPPASARAPAPVPGVVAVAADDLSLAERARHIATLDWDSLRQAVADCRACSLCESRRQTVFGVGHAQARWMIVGEAPGENEDAQGEPFVGAAGQLLDQMLAALRLSRTEGGPHQQVFIANTLKCRPPRNRNPAPEEMALCAPFLARQIALVQPRLILAMGRFAIQQLLGTDEAVGKLRGQVHRHAGVPVVVTYHPAYLLRQPVEKRKAWDDLCLAASVAADAGDALSLPSPAP